MMRGGWRTNDLTTIPQAAAPPRFTLDLSEGAVLVFLGRSIAVMEPPGNYEALGTALLHRDTGPRAGDTPLPGYMAVFRAGKLDEAGKYREIERYDLAYGHAIYGKKLVEGTAYYADGTSEAWRIQVEPLNMRWNWTRQPDAPHDRLVLRFVVPTPTGENVLWQTGRGKSLLTTGPGEYRAEDEAELLCLGSKPKNSFCLSVPVDGALAFSPVATLAAALPGESGWGEALCEATQIEWHLPPVALLRLDATWGLAHAATTFQGRHSFLPVQATLDFDTFYSRMALAALPLYLSGGDRQHYLPLSGIEPGAPPASIADIALACEFLPLADPRAAGVLMRDTLDRFLGQTRDAIESAWLLLLAGRYAGITGDPDFLGERLGGLREIANGLLALQTPGSAIPLLPTEDGPVKEPVFAAVCHAALRRLAELEHALAAPESARRWLVAADGIRNAALAAASDGGLVDSTRGTFVHSAPPSDGNEAPHTARANTRFDLHRFVLPCFLGLMDDTAQIQRAYEWIDDQYTYATGRGGASLPPGNTRGLTALLDVYVRQSRGVPGTDRVLQFVLDHALDFGVPMLGRPCEARRAETANFADAAPYLGIVLGLHYGLTYTREGWALSAPRPLANYPLTRVTGLRHRHAVFSVTWQGRGRIKRIVVDGRTHRGALLQDADGDHEVTVYLG